MKEYTFQATVCYEAETEEQAILTLQEDLKHNGNSLFKCISITENIRCCRNCTHYNEQDSTCNEGGYSEIGDPERRVSEDYCNAFKQKE